MKKKLQRVRHLLNSNYGRKYGWLIELDGKIIGELKNPRYADMFWVSYDIVALKKGEECFVNARTTWDELELRFKNKVMNEYAIYAFPSIPPNTENSMKGKVTMRGLYLIPKGLIEKVLIYFYSLLRGNKYFL